MRVCISVNEDTIPSNKVFTEEEKCEIIIDNWPYATYPAIGDTIHGDTISIILERDNLSRDYRNSNLVVQSRIFGFDPGYSSLPYLFILCDVD